MIAAAGLPIKTYVRKLFKKCPECAEMIKQEASACRYCGHRFDKDDIFSGMEKNLLNGTYDDRCNTASALIDIGTIPALVSVIEKAPVGFIKQAVELLMEKADSSITPRMIELLNEGRNQSRLLAAIQVLAKIRDADAIRALVDALDKPNLRNHVAISLEEIGTEAIPFLQEAVEQDKTTKEHAQKVIDRIQKAE